MKTGVYANAEKAENGANAQKFVVFLEKNGFSASEIDVNDENALSGTDVETERFCAARKNAPVSM